MNVYFNSYLEVLKRNFMLLLMALVLLMVTIFIWIGVPFFIVPSLIAELTSSFVIVYLFVSLSGGFLFSLYFVPLHFKVAKFISNNKGSRTANSFMILQITFILITSLIFAIVIGVLKGL